jgi:hypothetical protein
MKLLAYEINGNAVGIDLSSWSIEDLNGNAPFIVSNSTETGYRDISSVENWDEYGLGLIGSAVTFKDWKCLQREIKTLADAIVVNDYDTNWGNLNAAEKLIVCNYLLSKVTPTNFGATVPDATERTAIAISFDFNNRKARGSYSDSTGRVQAMRIYLFSKVGTADALETFRDVVSGSLLELYEGGIEGTVEDGIEGINDFFLSRAGTSYESTGLTTRSYAIVDGSGDTLTDVANAMVGISSNGLY